LKRLTLTISALLLLSGCATQQSSEPSAEPVGTPDPIALNISVSGAYAGSCNGTTAYATVYVKNESDEPLVLSKSEGQPAPKTNLRLRLMTEEGRLDVADYVVTDPEGIPAGREGEIYASFEGIFAGGFDGTFNRLEVALDDKIVDESQVSLSFEEDCS